MKEKKMESVSAERTQVVGVGRGDIPTGVDSSAKVGA
jgi:hypothetical protein